MSPPLCWERATPWRVMFFRTRGPYDHAKTRHGVARSQP